MKPDIEYDLEKMVIVLQKMEDQKEALLREQKKMLEKIQELRSGWTSEGGKAFAREVDVDWVQQIGNCITTLEELMASLQSAFDEYEKIEKEAETLLYI